MDDAKSGQALWSATYQRPAGEELALQAQTATYVADVIVNVREEIGPDARGMRSEVLAAYVKVLDLKRQNRGQFEQQRLAYERLAALAPNSSRVHSGLAGALDMASRLTEAPLEMKAAWAAQANAEAKKALEIDPHNAGAYMAMMAFRPSGDFLGREALLAQARKVQPNDSRVMAYGNGHLKDTGRLKAALLLQQQVIALDPYRPSSLAGAIFGYAGLGRYEEAKEVGARAAQLLPDNGSIRRANLFTALLYAPPVKASAALDRFQAGVLKLDQVSEQAWRQVIKARAGKLSSAMAAKALSAAPRAEYGIDPSTAMSAYALLGRTDEAFAEAYRAMAQRRELHFSNFFEAAAAGMRADPRFWPLMERAGLLTYWRRTGQWPDFCLAPDRPYDCKARADQLVGPARS